MMDVNLEAEAVAAKKVRRRSPVRKAEPKGRKTAVLAAISVVLGIANLVLFVQLGGALIR